MSWLIVTWYQDRVWHFIMWAVVRNCEYMTSSSVCPALCCSLCTVACVWHCTLSCCFSSCCPWSLLDLGKCCRAVNESYSFRQKDKLCLFAWFAIERKHWVMCGVNFLFSECYDYCHELDFYGKLTHFGVVERNMYSLICSTFCPFICTFQFKNSTHFNGIWCWGLYFLCLFSLGIIGPSVIKWCSLLWSREVTSKIFILWTVPRYRESI